MEEVVRGGFLARTHIGLDYFDASINRVAAWTIGTRNALKCLLVAMLEPVQLFSQCRGGGRLHRPARPDGEAKTLPFAAVWDEYCRRQSTPVGRAWLDEVRAYERTVLSKRGR